MVTLQPVIYEYHFYSIQQSVVEISWKGTKACNRNPGNQTLFDFIIVCY